MNRKSYFIIALIAVYQISIAQALLPSKKSILQKMELANSYFMKKYPDPGLAIITDKKRPSNIWTRSVYYEGLMALYNIDPNLVYLNYADQWGESHQWNLPEGIKTRNADNQCCGQTYIDLYRLQHQEKQIANIKTSIDNMLSSSKIDDWWWIDALQMAMPVFAKLGVLYHDDRYYQRMYDMYMYTKTEQGGGLFNPKDGLWWRDKSFVPPYKDPNGKNCYWSRGNGWVVAALVRVLQIMPKSAVGYQEYKNTFLIMMKALAPLQRKDGFWNVSLHDSTYFNGKETSGTALFVFGMAWGIKKGWLNRKVYLPIVVKAWAGLSNESLHPDGMLGYVQGTGKEPKDGQPVGYDKIPDFEDYGLGCFLLAGSEVYKLAPKK